MCIRDSREAQEAFPQFTVREAYISPIVRKRLAKEGVYKDSPTDALPVSYTHLDVYKRQVAGRLVGCTDW